MSNGTAPPPAGPTVGRTQRWAALATLTICVFLVGTAEWVMVGLLPDLAADLDVPLSVAGSLVTWYALTVTVAGPLVTVLILRLPQKRALLGMLAVFVAGNVVAASAGGFRVLLAARMFTALVHSTTFAVVLVIAVATVPAAQRGRAIAIVATGWSLATVFGAPLGTWIGNHYGWRATFWGISALSGLSIVAAAVCVRPARRSAPTDLRTEAASLRSRRVAVVLAIIVAAQAGLFTVYTYVTPLLAEVSGFRPSTITALLTVYGIGGLAGNVVGGWAADRAPWGSLCAVLAGFATVLATFTLTSHQRWAATATMLLLGVFAAALIPLLQERGLAAAPRAPTLITAVCASAFNLGVAVGSKIGSQALDAGLGLTDLAWIGALVALIALPLATCAARGRRARTVIGPAQGTARTTPRQRPAHRVQ